MLEDESRKTLRRVLRTGEGELNHLQAGWSTGPRKYGDFATLSSHAPVLSARICEQFESELVRAGRLVPIEILNRGPKDYLLYVVDAVVDCLDVSRSSAPNRPGGEIDSVILRPNAIDVTLPAFRVPQVCHFVFWNGAFVNKLLAFGLRGVKTMLIWSEDPKAELFPRPMR